MKIKKRKAMLIGLAATTLFGTQGCQCASNSEPRVYGPPDAIEDNQNEDVYGPPIMFDEDNQDAGVYGPPHHV